MRESVVAMSVFLPDMAQKQFWRQSFHEFFGDNLPAITYIPQTACFGNDPQIELFSIGGDSQNFEIKRKSENCVQVCANDINILFCGDIRPDDTPVFSYDRSLNAFQNMQSLLHESGGEVGPDTIFRVFSMTKVVTAAAALILFERGLLRLDDPIGDFIPSFQHAGMIKKGSDTNESMDYLRSKLAPPTT